MQQKEFYELVIGALLHDIGKFMQRAFLNEEVLSGRTLGLESQLCPTDLSTKKYTHRHVLWTNEFFERVLTEDNFPSDLNHSNVANIASYHHLPSSLLQKIVQIADTISAKHDRRGSVDPGKSWNNPENFFLKPIFEEIDINRGKPISGFAYPISKLYPGSSNIFSRQLRLKESEHIINSADGNRNEKGCMLFDDEFYRKLSVDYVSELYKSLWNDFEKEVKCISSLSGESVIFRLADILRRYTWCIPSSIVSIPDISLYDHSITTAIISAAIYLYFDGDIPADIEKRKEENIFILVGGDVSGIQKYLYEISHIAVGGVAKRLRARSFFISAFSDIAVHRICEEFDMPSRLSLLSSGGNFTLLLPAVKGWKDKLHEIKREFDGWCYKNLNSELRVSVDGIECTLDELAGDFSNLFEELKSRIEYAKNRGLSTILLDNDKWNEKTFVLDHVEFGDDETLCKSCRKFPGRSGEEGEPAICNKCWNDQELGTNLTKSNIFAFYKDKIRGGVEILNRWVLPVRVDTQKSEVDRLISSAYLVMVTGESSFDYNVPVLERHIANHIPTVESKELCEECRKKETCPEKDTLEYGQPLLFKCIAAKASGWPGLGFLKADVDNLGEVFKKGLKTEEVNNVSISRVVSLSRMIDFFFTARVEHLLKSDFNLIYTVYSGGDDLLFVGPWDLLIDFAQRLNNEFHDFTCHNPNLTISAGMAVSRSKAPISSVVREATEALEEAKSNVPRSGEGNEQISMKIGKNSFSLFNDCISWGQSGNVKSSFDFGEFLSLANTISWWLDEGIINATSIRRLYEFGKMARNYLEHGDVISLRFVPYLAYDISRNWPDVTDDNDERATARLWVQSLLNFDNPLLWHLATLATYAILKNRK